jgi:hypothetical protein
MATGFRLAGTIQEFFTDLDALKNKEHYFIIWQNDQRGEKVIVEGSFDSYFEEKGRTYIQAKLDKNLSFIKDNPVFIFEKLQGILFKGRFEFCINNILKIMADDKVFLKEKRDKQRFYFSYTKVEAVFRTQHPDSGAELTDTVRLNDITTDGLAFKLSSARAASMPIGSKVWLDIIHGLKLPTPIGGVIAHRSDDARVVKGKDNNLKLIGVKFDQTSELIGAVISQMKAQEE